MKTNVRKLSKELLRLERRQIDLDADVAILGNEIDDYKNSLDELPSTYKRKIRKGQKK